MDNLEKFILENKEKFENESPSKKVWRSIHTYFFNTNTIYLRWAAAVVLLVGLVWLINYYVQYKQQDTFVADLHRIETHYTSLINQKKNKLNRDPDLVMDIVEDTNEGLTELEKSYKELRFDFTQTKNKKEVLKHIEDNFQMRLAILDDQLYTLQQMKNLYDTSY